MRQSRASLHRKGRDRDLQRTVCHLHKNQPYDRIHQCANQSAKYEIDYRSCGCQVVYNLPCKDELSQRPKYS